MRRDLRKAEEEEDWKVKTTAKMGDWRDLRKAEEEGHWKVKTTAKMGGLC